MIKSTEKFKTAVVGDSRRIYIKAIVNISDPDMVLPDPTASSTAPWVKPEQIHDKVTDAPPRYATLERNRVILDGSFNVFPNDYQVDGSMGYALNSISGDDGSFSEPQVLTQPLENTAILQAFSIYFSSDVVDGIPVDFTVEVFQGQTAYFSKTFTENKETKLSFDGFTVHNPDSIKLTVTKWSLPGRRVRCIEIIPGVYEEWTDRMMASFGLTQQADFSCITLPYGTLTLSLNNIDKRFEPRNKNSLFASIEARQGIEPYIGVLLSDGSVEYKKAGIFYQYGDGWKTSSNDTAIDWSLVDIVGLLADRTYIPPDTLPTTLDGWIASVVAHLGDAFKTRYHVDPDYSAKAVTARSKEDVTGKKCGDIIRWACMVTGTWPRADSETGYLTAEPLWSEGNKLLLTALSNYPTMSANESVASLIFNLADGNGTQYAVSGNATSSEKTITIENPFIHTEQEALTVARQILSCYGGNIIDTIGRGDPSSEIGDVDTIWLDESAATTARRKMQTFAISDGVLQGCQSKMLQADGSYLFENMEIITQSGQWQAPAGVTSLRAILVQGGQGGMCGQDGSLERGERPSIDVDTGSIKSHGNYTAGYGEKGQNGVGGKVWYGTFNINPQQTFDVHIGAGGSPSQTYGVSGAYGEETTFGTYTSADGQVYANGFTDIGSGNSYGRTGVKLPLNGSGDGAEGGAGGDPGAGEWNKASLIIEGSGRKIYYTYWTVTEEPGKGKTPNKGGDGCVIVWWDKPEE